MLALGLGLWTPRISGATAFSPSSLSPLAWYDVATLSSLYVERSAETTLASVNGPVGTVRDLSGGGNHLRAPTDAARPTLRNSGALYWLEFDGTDDAIRAAFTVGTSFSRYGANMVNTFANNDRIYGGGGAAAGELLMGAVSGEIRVTSTVFGTPVSTPATGTAYTTSEVWSGTSATLSINAGAATNSTGLTSATPGGLTVGAYWNGAVHAAYGAINWYGCVMRVAPFSAGNLTDLEAYYKAKAGL